MINGDDPSMIYFKRRGITPASCHNGFRFPLMSCHDHPSGLGYQIKNEQCFIILVTSPDNIIHQHSVCENSQTWRRWRGKDDRPMQTSEHCYKSGYYNSFSEVQYIPRNMHTVFALLCFVVVIHWMIFPYPSGLLHWHCGNLTIVPVPAKQPWWIWINTSCEFIMNDCITTTKQSTTKPCAYFLGYTVPFIQITVLTAPLPVSLLPLSPGTKLHRLGSSFTTVTNKSISHHSYGYPRFPFPTLWEGKMLSILKCSVYLLTHRAGRSDQ